MADTRNPERGERWAGPIGPEHPAYERIRDAVQAAAGFATTKDIHNATGIPLSTLGRYMQQLASDGHLISQPNGIGRGYWWTWVGAGGQTTAGPAGVADTPNTGGTAVSVDVSTLPAVRLSLAPAATGGQAQGPFVISRFGAIAEQDRWQGMPLSAVGFIPANGDGRAITLWWGDYVDAAVWDAAVGLYLVTENRDGDWAKQLTVVAAVTELGVPNGQA